jgi:hypothetical protein
MLPRGMAPIPTQPSQPARTLASPDVPTASESAVSTLPTSWLVATAVSESVPSHAEASEFTAASACDQGAEVGAREQAEPRSSKATGTERGTNRNMGASGAARVRGLGARHAGCALELTGRFLCASRARFGDTRLAVVRRIVNAELDKMCVCTSDGHPVPSRIAWSRRRLPFVGACPAPRPSTRQVAFSC